MRLSLQQKTKNVNVRVERFEGLSSRKENVPEGGNEVTYQQKRKGDVTGSLRK